MKGMKMIGKVSSKEAVQMFLDQIPYSFAWFTGGLGATVYHYGDGERELAAVTRHSNLKNSECTYILYMKK